MASQRQARTGGASAGATTKSAKNGTAKSATDKTGTAKAGVASDGKSGGIKTTTIATGSAASRSKGGKAAAGRAQARAAREAQARADTRPAAESAEAPAWQRFLRRKVADDLPAAPGWLQWTTLALAIAGLGVSIYLTIVELAPGALICSATGIVNCANVIHSPEGHIVGIPVAYFGLAFYVFLVALNTPWAWRRRELFVQRLRLASIVVGICFVLYLVYAELIEIKNICIWCTSVHVITFLLFVLIVFDAMLRRPPLEVASQGS
jgi:uncharacterized membrane protein